MPHPIKPIDILNFWYSPPINQHWFKPSAEIDQLIRDKYEALWKEASEGAVDCWRETPEGCLALILLFDQFPLNMFRGKAAGFSTEARAIELSLYGIEQQFDARLPQSQLSFFYMPLMHSESLKHQQLSVEKFTQAGLTGNTRFALHHLDIIQRFGRFPHRNEMLGRPSTQAEIDYLNSKEAFKG